MLASIGTDIGKYLDESRSGFITGQMPLSGMGHLRGNA